MLRAAPCPVDVQDLQFRLQCRLKIFENKNATPFLKPCGAVTVASRFGLIFVGTNSANFQVIQLQQLESIEYSRSVGDKEDYLRREISLPSPPTYLSVNCDHTILAIVYNKDNCPCVEFYDVKSFYQANIVKLEEIRLSATPNVFVVDVGWNPTLGGIFTACKSDGTLGVYELKSPGIDINELPAAAGATCFCWSPKGKQIAVGSRDGKITQYKPDLKAVKVINGPPLPAPHSVISLQWVSNYQFIGVFHDRQIGNSSCVIVVDAPKTGEVSFINYEDICYSSSDVRAVQFYTILEQHWNILMVASSNSMEVGVLGLNNNTWTQWIMGDACRPELPLTRDRQETLPIGLALDTGSIQPVSYGETTLPPAPMLLLLSHYGTLCCFTVVNAKENAVSVCSPPEIVSDCSGLNLFTFNKTIIAEPIKEEQKPRIGLFGNPPLVAADHSNMFEAKSSQPSNISPFGASVIVTPIIRQKNDSRPAQVSEPQMFSSLTGVQNVNKIGAQVQLKPTPTTAITPIKVPDVKETLKIEPAIEVSRNDEDNEILFGQIVKEECVFLESQLKALLHQGQSLKINLGTELDQENIVKSTNALEEFVALAVDTSTSQQTEIHILKQNLLQTWAWYEEAKSRHNSANDEIMGILLKSQPLDSAAEKQLNDIRHSVYYLESQLAQANRALDEQWEKFQDYCRSSYKDRMPTMEVIFQTMVKQNAIIQKQSYVLKDIASRIKNRPRSAFGSSLLLTLETVEDAEEKLKNLRLNPVDISDIQFQHVLNRTKCLTKTKVDKLRNFLRDREYPHVSLVKPQLSSSTILQTTSPMKKDSTILGAKVSPVSKGVETVTKLKFHQSTPKLECSKINTKPPDIVATDAMTNFKFNDVVKPLNFGGKTQTNVTKGILPSSNSAFVSTSFGISSSTPVVSLATSKPSLFGVVTSVSQKQPNERSVSKLAAANQPITTISIINLSNSKDFTFTSAPMTQGSILNVPKSPLSTSFNTSQISSIPTTGLGVNSPSLLPNKNVPISIVNTFQNTPASPSIGAAKPFSFSSLSNTKIQQTNVTVTPVPSISNAPGKPVDFSATSSTMKSQPLVFTTTPSITITPKTAVTTSSSLFSTTSQNTTSPTTKPLLFTPLTTASTSQPLFGTTSSSQSIFSSVIPKPATTTTTQTIFGSYFSGTPKTVPSGTTISPPSSFFGSNAGTNTAKSTVSGTTSITSGISTIFSPTSTPPKTIFASSIASATPSTSTSTTTSIIFTNTSSNSTNSKPLFGNTTSTPITANTTASVLANTNGASIFGSTIPSTTSPSKPLFGEAIASTTSTSSIFAASTTTGETLPVFSTTATGVTASKSVFGTPTQTTPAPAPAPPKGLFGDFVVSTASSTNTSSLFVTPATSPVSSTTTVFGNAPNGTTSPKSILECLGVSGSATPTTTTTSSLFGATPLATATSSIFGNAPISTATSSAFGGTTTPSGFGVGAATSAPSVFGGTPTTVTLTVAPSLFGTNVTTSSGFGAVLPSTTSQTFGGGFGATQQKSLFGTTQTTQQQQQQQAPIFGAQTSQPFLFGKPPQSVFGSPTSSSSFDTTTTTVSPFGQNQSVFGQQSFGQPPLPPPPPAFGSSNFGNSSFGQNSGTIFGGSPSATSSGSIFGNTPTTSSGFGGFGAVTSSASVFGTPATAAPTPFGSNNAFGSTTSQPSSSSSFSFAAPATSSGNSFGFGAMNVGSTPTSSSFGGFGQTAPNPFATAQEQKSIFGAAPTTSSSSIFGSAPNFGNTQQQSSAFGGSNSFGQSSSVFGQQQQQQSAFGQSSFGNTFGAQQPSGPFSGGTAGVGQTGFGSFSKPPSSGFGSAPVFGGSPTPAFGGAPSFGGAPAFGSSPTFGSPSKIFGGGPTAGFGSPGTAQNSSFGNLANQNTVGFGNLAQQANSSSPNAQFSGNSSFSSWR